MDEKGKGGGRGDWEVSMVVQEDIHLCVHFCCVTVKVVRQIVCVSFSVFDISHCKGLLSNEQKMLCIQCL